MSIANPFQKKLSDWQAQLDDLEKEINLLKDVTSWNFPCKLIKQENLDDLYSSIDKIESQISSAINTFSARSSEDSDYDIYLSKMSEAILKSNNLRYRLFKKDARKYLEEFQTSRGDRQV
jgi:archaellum component FlaC